MHYIPVAPPPPPKTTAIFRDFKKSTAMCKVHNVGLRYIKLENSISNSNTSRQAGKVKVQFSRKEKARVYYRVPGHAFLA